MISDIFLSAMHQPSKPQFSRFLPTHPGSHIGLHSKRHRLVEV